MIYLIVAVGFVYIVCTVIDFIRQKTVEKIWIYYLDNYYESFVKKISELIQKAIVKVWKMMEKYYG